MRFDSYAGPRIVAGLVALPLGLLAVSMIPTLFRGWFDPLGAAFLVCSGAAAALCGWFALRGHIAESRRRMRAALIGGLVFGGVAFAAGFFGPIILAPGANQGPLLGIFYTGPLGFGLGVAAGWLYALLRTPAKRSG